MIGGIWKFDIDMFENIIGGAGIFGMMWVFHLVPSLIVSLPIWICGRRRASWFWSDYATAIIPFALWSALLLCDDKGKTLSNLSECLYLGCVVPIAAIIRVVVGRRGNERIVSFALLSALCIVAFGLYLFMPALPE
jgi:hypothetical protein